MEIDSFDHPTFENAFKIEFQKVPNQVATYLNYSTQNKGNIHCLLKKIDCNLKNSVVNSEHINNFDVENLKNIDTVLKYIESFNISFKQIYQNILLNLDKHFSTFTNSDLQSYYSSQKTEEIFDDFASQIEANSAEIEGKILPILKQSFFYSQNLANNFRELQVKFRENLAEILVKISGLCRRRNVEKEEMICLEEKFNQVNSIIKEMTVHLSNLKQKHLQRNKSKEEKQRTDSVLEKTGHKNIEEIKENIMKKLDSFK